MNDPEWGLLPDVVIGRLREKTWNNRRALKSRLKGDKPFPIRVNLKPPRGQEALVQLDDFHRFVTSWKEFPFQACVEWETRTFRQLSRQKIPTRFVVNDIASLAAILGQVEQQVLADWQAKIAQLLDAPFAQGERRQHKLFSVLIDHLEDLETYSNQDMTLLINLIPQLMPGMGKGCYLRALPVNYVDTKFVEQNYRLIERITNVVFDNSVIETGGLLAWLDCRDNPKGWLMVRPLCENAQAALGGLPLLQMDTDTLLELILPARHILVVENVQSGLALPTLEDTIAVFGGGKNVSWLSAIWLQSKRVAYWGDIDSEGLAILSDARGKLPSLEPVMMNEKTVITFSERMVGEPDSVPDEPQHLTSSEQNLFRKLRDGTYMNRRLEQERIAADYVRQSLESWVMLQQ